MKKTYSITIAIPIYNEQDAIENTVINAVREVKKYCKEFEILIIDDGSTDNSANVIDKLKSNKYITTLHHKKNKGFTGAIKSCYKHASKELVFLAPGDGQVDFRELGDFIKMIQKGYDVVIGYRKLKPIPLYRKLNSFLFHIYCKVFLKLPFNELSTVVLWKKKVLDGITIESDDHSAMIEPELIYKAYRKGYKFAEVPFTFLPRKTGKAKGSNLFMILITLKEMIRFWILLKGKNFLNA